MATIKRYINNVIVNVKTFAAKAWAVIKDNLGFIIGI